MGQRFSHAVPPPYESLGLLPHVKEISAIMQEQKRLKQLEIQKQYRQALILISQEMKDFDQYNKMLNSTWSCSWCGGKFSIVYHDDRENFVDILKTELNIAGYEVTKMTNEEKYFNLGIQPIFKESNGDDS